MTFCNSSITYHMEPKQKQISFIKIPKQEGANESRFFGFIYFLQQEDKTYCISAPEYTFVERFAQDIKAWIKKILKSKVKSKLCEQPHQRQRSSLSDTTQTQNSTSRKSKQWSLSSEDINKSGVMILLKLWTAVISFLII